MTIFILAREENEKTANLRKVFGGFSHSVILDKNDQSEICIALCDPPRKTAWDYAFDYVEENDIKGPVCFVEDDVAGPKDLFDLLFQKLENRHYDLAVCLLRDCKEIPEWATWGRARNYFDHPWKSLNPFSILSERLMRDCFEFKRKWGHYTYLEVLFASLAKEKGRDIIDLQGDADFSCLFPSFYYKPPLLIPVRGICHPVKNDNLHTRICSGV